MPTPEYHRRQAEVAALLALAEPDPVKAIKLHILALGHFEKAEQAKADHLSREDS